VTGCGDWCRTGVAGEISVSDEVSGPVIGLTPGSR